MISSASSVVFLLLMGVTTPLFGPSATSLFLLTCDFLLSEQRGCGFPGARQGVRGGEQDNIPRQALRHGDGPAFTDAFSVCHFPPRSSPHSAIGRSGRWRICPRADRPTRSRATRRDRGHPARPRRSDSLLMRWSRRRGRLFPALQAGQSAPLGDQHRLPVRGDGDRIFLPAGRHAHLRTAFSPALPTITASPSSQGSRKTWMPFVSGAHCLGLHARLFAASEVDRAERSVRAELRRVAGEQNLAPAEPVDDRHGVLGSDSSRRSRAPSGPA